jgi:hypothetical protein
VVDEQEIELAYSGPVPTGPPALAKVWGSGGTVVGDPAVHTPCHQNEDVGHESSANDWGPRVVLRANPVDHEVPLNVFR